MLYKSDLDKIYLVFRQRINDFRVLYMSLLVQEEQAAIHISKSTSISSIYLSQRNKFVFGERYFGDSTFYTDVDVEDCLESLFDVENTLNELKRIMILKLTAIHEDFYRSLAKYFLIQSGKEASNTKLNPYVKGNPEQRLINIQRLYNVACGFSTEYQALNFLFRIRNCIAHEDGIISELYFKDKQNSTGNIREYRKHSNKHGTVIELGKKIIISEYDFSELIHLVELVGNRFYSSIISESPLVEKTATS